MTYLLSLELKIVLRYKPRDFHCKTRYHQILEDLRGIKAVKDRA